MFKKKEYTLKTIMAFFLYLLRNKPYSRHFSLCLQMADINKTY
jgi:hypothetical protein